MSLCNLSTRSFSLSAGEKKLGRVICPDPWKSGARNTVGESWKQVCAAGLVSGYRAVVYTRTIDLIDEDLC